MTARALRYLLVTLLIALTSCALHPRGEKEERERARRASEELALAGRTAETEPLEPLAPSASLKEILDYAYAANHGLHRMYWEWVAAIETVPQEASPGTNLAVSLESMFEDGETSLERTTLGVGNDPMSGIPWPGKLTTAGRRALEMARAAGFRFLNARLELRTQVLTTYYDCALTAELIDLKGAEVPLLETACSTLEAGIKTGTTSTGELLMARTQRDLAASDLATLKSRATGQLATLNALLGRDPFAALELPGEIPPQRGLSYSDAEILALLAEDNPELEALAQESEAGKDAVSLMRRQYIPDLGLTLSGDLGGMGKSVMAMLTTPVLRSQAIQASIRQARAELEARRALRRQVESDLKAQTVLMLYDLRNAEREAQLLGGTVIPRLEQAVETSRASYVTGRSSLGDLIEAQRMLLDTRRMLAELRIEREKLLVEIEKIAGMEPEVVSQTESRGAPK